MKFKYLAILLLFLLLIGCVKPQPRPMSNGEKKTCSALGGTICKMNEICTGISVSAASDTSNCCNKQCIPKTTPQGNDVDIPKFDFGKTDSDTSLGKLN